MKLGRLLIAAAFLVSTSAGAGIGVTDLSVNKMKTFNFKYSQLENGKIKTVSVKTKEVAETLKGDVLTKQEKLVAYFPCPISDMLNYGGFYIGVWDFDVGEPVGQVMGVSLDGNEVVELDKNNNIKTVDVTADFDDFDLQGQVSLTIKAKILKDKKNNLDGENCVNKLEANSMVGEVFDADTDEDLPLMQGKMIANKVSDSTTEFELFPLN